jgi:hypothetical protein
MPTGYVDSSYKEHKLQNSQAESACDFDRTKCGVWCCVLEQTRLVDRRWKVERTIELANDPLAFESRPVWG